MTKLTALGCALLALSCARGAPVLAADPAADQRQAEARKAVAEADRAEALARIPVTASKALAGSLDLKQFGAAGLVKAFDLALGLATELCQALPADRKTVIYDPAATQGVLAARAVDDGLSRISEALRLGNRQLQAVIEQHAPPAGFQPWSPVPLATVPATIRLLADTTSLFKTDLSASASDFGLGTRPLFETALGVACPEKLAGFGSGYLGERDPARYQALLGRVRTLADLRGQYAERIDLIQQLSAAAKGDEKKLLAGIASAASAQLKTVDAFADSLKVGEVGADTPLYLAMRYLGYGQRTGGALVLDSELRLEGMSLVKDNLFTGQHLRLSGAAFLWYRLHEVDGTLRRAATLRRITRPVDVDLRGDDPGTGFWDPAR